MAEGEADVVVEEGVAVVEDVEEDGVAEVFATQIWVVGADVPVDDLPEDGLEAVDGQEAADGQVEDDQAQDGQAQDDQAADGQAQGDQVVGGQVVGDQVVDGQAMGEAVGTADEEAHGGITTDFARLTICFS